MNIHLIVDFQYNFHKHRYAVESGKLSRLSAVVNGREVETTYMYHTLSDIEGYRRKYLESNDGTKNDVTVSICLDCKSERRDENSDYKSNRDKNKLRDFEIESIERSIEVLKQCGYNVYREPGTEADDLIKSLVDLYKKDFDMTIIHTNDSDILVNLDSENRVYIQRYKSSLRRHQPFTEETMAGLMSDEFDCDIRNNTIILYKSLVGDKSDVIKGAKGFGKKAFDKYMDYLDYEMGLKSDDYKKLKDWENVEELLKNSVAYLGERVVNEALDSLGLVRFKQVRVTGVKPEKRDSLETRKYAYEPYKMFSLIKE